MPFVLVSAFVLLAALWMGLQRAGWELPSVGGITPIAHGGIMVAGFLGSLISLERAIALQKKIAYVTPVLNGTGAMLLLLGAPALLGKGLLVAGALGFVVLCLYMISIHPTLDITIMGLGAFALVVANVIWLAGSPVYQCVPWWICFLVLTIAGERLELSRVLRPTRNTKALLVTGVFILLLGLVITLFAFETGVRIAGIGLASVAVWLIVYDIARKTIRSTGLTRYIAACLLPGYVWMLLGGVLWIVYAPYFIGGMYYDAMLHTVFIGFALSMIFGHAPIILPAIINIPVIYAPRFYVHLILLHSLLLLRITGDLSLTQSLQQWGALLNVIAVLVFMGNTIFVVRSTLISANNKHAQS